MIDDEIHGATLEFFNSSEEIYKNRITEAEEIYKQSIDKPFEFTKDESFELDPDKIGFASNRYTIYVCDVRFVVRYYF